MSSVAACAEFGLDGRLTRPNGPGVGVPELLEARLSHIAAEVDCIDCCEPDIER